MVFGKAHTALLGPNGHQQGGLIGVEWFPMGCYGCYAFCHQLTHPSMARGVVRGSAEIVILQPTYSELKPGPHTGADLGYLEVEPGTPIGLGNHAEEKSSLGPGLHGHIVTTIGQQKF